MLLGCQTGKYELVRFYIYCIWLGCQLVNLQQLHNVVQALKRFLWEYWWAKPGLSVHSCTELHRSHRPTEATKRVHFVQYCKASCNVCWALWKSRCCRSLYRIAWSGNMDNLEFSSLYGCSLYSPVHCEYMIEVLYSTSGYPRSDPIRLIAVS